VQFVDHSEDATGESASGGEHHSDRCAADPPEVDVAPRIPGELPYGTSLETPGSLAIDLGTALQLTAGQNPQVAFALERIQEAFAQLRAAEVLWVPSLRGGVNYNKHEGRIQDVQGNIIETSRGSIYTGLGAQAVGAGSPAVPGLVVNLHLRDAVFQPRIADRAFGARQQASRATTNDALLNTALAYMDLLEAVQIKAVAEETLGNAEHLAELTASFARAGQGLQSDADRAQAELSIRRIEMRRAAENARVAAIRLSRLLSQDPSQHLEPQEPALVPIDLVHVDDAVQELVAMGLTNRPELAESGLLVDEAVFRLRRERFAPLIPSVLLGLSYGGNGGGLGGDIIRFGDRLDFDAAAFWEVRNFGFGERAARDAAHSRVHQAMWQQVQVMDQVASEVAEAHTQVASREQEIELAKAGIQSAADSYRRNSERIRNAQGLPIETLQSIQALDQARRQYVRAVADYNRAQFRLHRALGWPIE
jgi:outer membrane protein TolC